jgi:hypothetical protein
MLFVLRSNVKRPTATAVDRADRDNLCRGSMLFILHSGQTGVERGAHHAAIAAGFRVAGFMPLDARDELGHLPEDIASCLTPFFERGPRRAVHANIRLASGVLLVLPRAHLLAKSTGMRAIQQRAKAAAIPCFVADLESNVDDVVRWMRALRETSGSTRVMVTGPRETRWSDGEKIARRFVAAVSMTS